MLRVGWGKNFLRLNVAAGYGYNACMLDDLDKAILRHRQAGMQANAMVAWAVPEERREAIGRLLAEEPLITHCYERPGFGEFALFSMIHAHSVPELETVIEGIAQRIGIKRFKVYTSVRELKKSSMRYF